MNRKRQAIIVGFGPAGVNAARMLCGLGLDVLIMDENRRPGGRFLRRAPQGLGLGDRPEKDALRAEGLRLIDGLPSGRVEMKTRTRILEIESDGTIWALDGDDRLQAERAEYIVLCTGAREKFLPFPGWTLPGVISSGGAQISIKSCGILPGHEMLVGGCGPLPLVLAGQILAAGGRVRAFWDQTPPSAVGQSLVHFRHHFQKMVQGLGFLARLVLSGTSVRPCSRIVEARGDKVLRQVVLARMDARGGAMAGTEKVYDVDCLAVGHGFTPNIELPMLAGCDLEYDRSKGGWVVKTDRGLVTSLPKLVAAGEITGIAGARKSFLEGRLAGLSVARLLGKVDEETYGSKMKILAREIRREMDFGVWVNGICRPPAGLVEDIPDRTIICRCEDVTMGQVREQMENGFSSLDGLKKSTNAGMGNCQGRTCGPIIQDILDTLGDELPENPAPFSVRSPVKPVPLSALAAWAERLKDEPSVGASME